MTNCHHVTPACRYALKKQQQAAATAAAGIKSPLLQGKHKCTYSTAYAEIN
jgi:hypothetical protein